MGSSPLQDGYSFWGLKKATERGGAKKSLVDALEKAWGHYRERVAAAAKVESTNERAKVHAAINEHVTALQALVDQLVA